MQQSVEDHGYMAAAQIKGRVVQGWARKGMAESQAGPLLCVQGPELQALPLLDMGDVWLLSLRRLKSDCKVTFSQHTPNKTQKSNVISSLITSRVQLPHLYLPHL